MLVTLTWTLQAAKRQTCHSRQCLDTRPQLILQLLIYVEVGTQACMDIVEVDDDVYIISIML